MGINTELLYDIGVLFGDVVLGYALWRGSVKSILFRVNDG